MQRTFDRKEKTYKNFGFSLMKNIVFEVLGFFLVFSQHK